MFLEHLRKKPRPVRSVFNFIASMRMEQANNLLALSSTTSAKGKMSKPVTTVVNKSPLKKTYVKTARTVDNGLMKHNEDVIGPATHLTMGISRSNPLFKPNWVYVYCKYAGMRMQTR
jgi:hypothetical protein